MKNRTLVFLQNSQKKKKKWKLEIAFKRVPAFVGRLFFVARILFMFMVSVCDSIGVGTRRCDERNAMVVAPLGIRRQHLFFDIKKN